MESIERIGARNVAAEHMGTGGLVTISSEQLLLWDPEVVVAIDPAFVSAAGTDDVWKGVKAVRTGRLYIAPDDPFGWIDSPPSVNRLIGLRWLGRVSIPKVFPEDLRAETRNFYTLFYHRTPDERQLNELLERRGGRGNAATCSPTRQAPAQNRTLFRDRDGGLWRYCS